MLSLIFLVHYRPAVLARSLVAARINWEKLAAKAGFQDAAAAKAHYEVLSTLEDSKAARTRDSTCTVLKRVKVEAGGYSNRLDEDE
ncbi:hypothetical protein PG988_001039 [Apiospora saccharicola]